MKNILYLFAAFLTTFSLSPVAFSGVDNTEGGISDELRSQIEATRKATKWESNAKKKWEKSRWGSMILIGNVPGEFVGLADDKVQLSKMTIKEGVITEIKKITVKAAEELKAEKDLRVVKLRVKANTVAKDWDVIYPGLIDLHNHTKQNFLGLWPEAQGQFGHRHQWRAWGNYKVRGSANWNPWITWGSPITCSAFRWSEIQAMSLGTIYLQGPSSCVGRFAIHQVEDSNSYNYKKGAKKLDRVNAPTDIIVPADYVYVWNYLRPLMMDLAGIEIADKASIDEKIAAVDKALAKGVTYGQALKKLLILIAM